MKNVSGKVNLWGGIVVFLIIILVVVIVVVGKNNKEEEINKGTDEIVTTIEGGTQVNNSSKIKETKKLGSVEISEIKLRSQDNETILTAKAKNAGNSIEGDYFIKVTFLDEAGNEIGKVKGYLDKLDINEERNISIKASSNLVDAYDVKIERNQ